MKSLTQTLSTLVIGLLVFSQAGLATSSTEDRSDTIARLEAQANRIERQSSTALKIGALRRSELSQSSRETRDEIDRLAAGGAVDSERVDQLLPSRPLDSTMDRESLTTTATRKRDALARKAGTNFKVGHSERTRIRNDVASLDSMIAALESGRDVDDAELASLLGGMNSRAPLTAEEQLNESRVELASRKRQLADRKKIGSVRRNEIRSEIEALDSMIGQLEAASR